MAVAEAADAAEEADGESLEEASLAAADAWAVADEMAAEDLAMARFCEAGSRLRLSCGCLTLCVFDMGEREQEQREVFPLR